MIKFFSSIRKRLLSENKITRYLIYAFGEIILVVFGILIALSINNWNEDRINKQKEVHYLVGFKNDVTSQIKALETRIVFLNNSIMMAESILSDYSKTGKLLEIDNINFKLSKMMYTLGYPEINTTFNEITATGNLDLIKSKKLRASIINYYQFSESNTKSIESNINEVFYGKIFPVISSSVILLAENFDFKTNTIDENLLTKQLTPALEASIKDPTNTFNIINSVSMRLILAKTNLSSVEGGKKFAEFLLKSIETELSN